MYVSVCLNFLCQRFYVRRCCSAAASDYLRTGSFYLICSFCVLLWRERILGFAVYKLRAACVGFCEQNDRATCKGSGAKPGTKRVTCPRCGGNGQVRMNSGFFTMAVTCEQCRGEGTIIQSPCPECRGRGRVKKERKLQLKVPAGVDTGSRLRVPGEGEAGLMGGGRGDLYVSIYVKPDNVFQRDGDDIICEVPLSFVQAAIGGDIEVPTLDGKVRMKVPAGTQTGRVFRLRGRGMPNIRGFARGDQHVQVIVQTPTKLTSAQKALLEEFAREGGKRAKESGSLFEKMKRKMKG